MGKQLTRRQAIVLRALYRDVSAQSARRGVVDVTDATGSRVAAGG
jgi:hypothetical protein